MRMDHPAKGTRGTFKTCTTAARCRVCHLLIEHPEECRGLFDVIVSIDGPLSIALARLEELFADAESARVGDL